MPAFALSPEGEELGRYDVVGRHAAGTDGFVRHVGLYNSERERVTRDQSVAVAHIGPPLQQAGQMRVHVAGRVPLSSTEVTSIGVWIEKIADEVRTAEDQAQYWIDPPWKDVTDPNTGVRRYRRYSCAGFVLDAHRQVDVELLNLEKTALPEVNAQTLGSAYPRVDLDRLQDFGLADGGPWRIVLAGYVIHALNRANEEIRARPYQAQLGDERF
jgi:hypothetical protein